MQTMSGHGFSVAPFGDMANDVQSDVPILRLGSDRFHCKIGYHLRSFNLPRKEFRMLHLCWLHVICREEQFSETFLLVIFYEITFSAS